MCDFCESLYVGKSDRFFDGILGGYCQNNYDRWRKCSNIYGGTSE